MRRGMALAIVLAGLLVVGMATPGQAAGQERVKPTAKVISVSKVYLVDGRPMVSGTYKCTGRLSHLWVSSKQGKGDLTSEGSGADARSWYQRTWDNKLNCNGRRHNRLFAMDPTGDTGAVRPGRRSYVQFCLLTANRPRDFEEGGAFDSSMRYRQVVVF